MKRILFITRDNNNIFIKYLINSLKKNFRVDLHNPTKFQKNFFIKFTNYFVVKIIDIFSNYKTSNKENFYIEYQIRNSQNILKKIYFILKKLINKFNLSFDKSDIYFKFFQNSKKYKHYLKKYDLVISDFRLNNLYNPDLRLIYEAAHLENIKLISWVYSWDNIYHASVMRHADYIFVWTNYFKKLMNLKHKYKNKKIIKTGCIQFDYLKKKKSYKNKIILFACSYGTDQNNTGDNFIKDEIEFLKTLSQYVWKINDKYNILVRPYPSALEYEYKDITKLKNIRLNKYGKLIQRRKDDSEKIRFDLNLDRKLDQIINSDMVISFGSTFNIEAAILDKIVLHIDYTNVSEPKYTSYNYFKNQMEYLKVLKGKDFPNIIKNKKQLEKVIHDIVIKKDIKKYLKYNYYLKKIFFDDRKATEELKLILKKL